MGVLVDLAWTVATSSKQSTTATDRENEPLSITATLSVAKHPNAANNRADTLPDMAAEARRQRVTAMLAENPGIRYAMTTDINADPHAVILTLAYRGRATCELRIPRGNYDPFLLFDLIERHSGRVH